MTEGPGSVASSTPAIPRGTTLFVVTAALFTDALVYGIVIPFLPLYTDSLGLSESATGALFASYALVLVAGAFVLPWLTLRWGIRRVMLAGFVGMIVSTAVFALAQSYPVLIAARAAQGLSAASTWSLGPALLADVFTEGRGKALGTAISGSALGTVLGPPLGGVLFDLGGFVLPFVVVSVSPLLLLVVAARRLPEIPPREGARVTLLWLFRQPRALMVAAIVAVSSALTAFLEPTLPLHLSRRFDVSATVNGLVFGAAVVSYAAVSPWVGGLSDRLGRERLSALGLLLCAASLPVLGMADVVWAVALGMAFFGACLALALAPTLAAMADVVEALESDFASGYVMSNSAYAVGMMLGPLAGGALMQVAGFGITLWAGSAVALVSAVAVLLGLRKR